MIEGVHRIELPLPFTLGLVNVYLIRLSDGYLLISNRNTGGPTSGEAERLVTERWRKEHP